MSGDVQPRKRKDKKKKRESFDVRKSEGELIFSRKSSLQEDEASHGVHFTKMGSDDVHLHVHDEHGTGGDWCAKIIFFTLMTIILGIVCMIILEYRGISDVDTPLSKSRFSNYFDGWVDENRDDHDDHHDIHGSLEHDDHDDHDGDEDDHDEPFEEEADHSEGDEDVAEEEDENVTPEEEDEDNNATGENVTAEKDMEEEEDDEENITAEEDVDENATAEDENVTEETTVEINDEDDENDDNKTKEEDEDDNVTTETSVPNTSQTVQDDDNDEDEDDGAFDSLEKVVDNDASEIELLLEKARQQAAAETNENLTSAEDDLQDEAENAPSWASPLAVKIGVGLALALVARLVLIRKNPISNEAAPVPEHLMARRLTIANPDEFVSEDVDVIDAPLPEDDYSEEEIEIEEEIEYIEDDVEATGEENQVDAGDNGYAPETFEQLNAMYRSKDYKEETPKQNETKQSTKTDPYSYQSPYSTSFNNNNNRHNNNNSNLDNKNELPKTSGNSYNNNAQPQAVAKLVAPVLEAPSSKTLPNYSPPKELPIKSETFAQPPKKDVTYDMDYEKTEKQKPHVEHKKEISHDMDYQPNADGIDYDEDDIYDDDEAQDYDSEDLDDDDDDLEEEEGDDDEELSDVDDSELMNRLEAKYGKLPAKDNESDENHDDATWTRNY